MEISNDGRFNLIETDSLVVKKMNSYTLSANTILDESSSGTLYLLDSTSNNITITLPSIKEGINYEFIFNKTTTNSIIFQTNQNPIDNSKFIGTDWLYLKRTDIAIEYSLLSGTKLTFKNSQKGEYIKFYCDGTNYYIVEKNDTNNNINNVITSYPSNSSFNYIVNISTTKDGYKYNLMNENTNEEISSILMNNTYNFKFNTLSTEYNNITNITATLSYNLHTYIDYYNEILYNFDNETSTVKYKYKYPVFNFRLKDANNTEISKLDLFNTTYKLNLNNNSILYPGYLYTKDINVDTDDTASIISKTSKLFIDYNTIENNLIITNEFNSTIYDHNNSRAFLLVNRDISYQIKYINSSPAFTIAITNTSSINYSVDTKFKFTSNTATQEGFIITIVDEISTLSSNKKLYYLYFKCTIDSVDKIFKIPVLFVDQFLLQPKKTAYINIKNKFYDELPKVSGVISYNYEFDIVSNDSITILDNLEMSFLNTKQSASSIDENIFALMKEKLIIPVQKADINDYLLKFMSSGTTTEYYNTTFSTSGNYKIVSLYIDYKNTNGINVSYYSNYSNITGGSFKLNQFVVSDFYSGKVVLLNLKSDITLNIKDNIEGNYYEFVVDNDNAIDTNIYTLTKKTNTNGVDEYYFIKNSDTNNLLKNIDLYTSNKYEILVDKDTISLSEINRAISKFNDLIQFSDIKDGLINFKKVENYNFITKKINEDNTISLVFDLINTITPTQLYYYNKNIRNIGGIINIVSVDNRLNNIYLDSLNPFSSEYKYYVNNISYERFNNAGVDNYILSLKKLKKGDTLKLYFNNNTNIIRELKLSDNDDNVVKYPENIISNNDLTLKLIKDTNSNLYDINLYDSKLNTINNSNTTFKFIKNQSYTIEQKDITNYNLDNSTIDTYYLQLKYLNSQLTYQYYTDSKFTNQVNTLQLFRGIKYSFKQYHRSNYNPDIDIDLNRVFKLKLKKNGNVNKLYINDMEQYIPNILINTVYYFDLSDVLSYNCRLSLYEDGRVNNTFIEYKPTNEVTYKKDTSDNINLIKLKLASTNTNTTLYYYSEKLKSVGSSINIIKDSIGYLLSIKENKLNVNKSISEYYLQKSIPKYGILFKDNISLEEKKNVLFYKDELIPELKYKLNFDSSISNKLYTSSISSIIASEIITIYVNEVYNPVFPLLSYFEFYTNSSLNPSSKIDLPLTLLQNKKYKFKQTNYKESKFKFYLYFNEYPLNYVNDINNSLFYDNNIITYESNEGITLNTTNFINNYIYYSGIHYNTTDLYTDLVEEPKHSSLQNNDRLIVNYKMLLILEKDIYLADNENSNNDNSVHITSSLANNSYDLSQTTLKTKNIFQNDSSLIYFKNKNTTTQKEINITITTPDHIISYLNTNDIFISSISNSKYDNHNAKFNRNINLLTNVEYKINYKENTTVSTNYKIKYSNNTLLTTIDTSNLFKSTISNVKYDYVLYKTSNETVTYTSNETTNYKLTDTNDVFTLKTFTNKGSLTNYFTIHHKPNTSVSDDNKFHTKVYEYLITTHPDITNFTIECNNSHSKYDLISIDYNDSINNSTNSLIVTPNTTNIQYVNIVIRDKTGSIKNTYVYTLKILKDISGEIIVNYGKLIVNDLNNNINEKNRVYLSKPIQFSLDDVDTSLPNSKLFNIYTLELLATEFDSDDIIKHVSSKQFVLNKNTYDVIKSSDTILEENIISNNLYVSDFRTIILDVSHTSLLNENITFYTDEKALNKVDHNIIYTGNCGETNSKIVLNINPNMHSVLFYYSSCLYETKFKYNMKITSLSNLEYYKTSDKINTTKDTYYGVYDVNILPFLENNIDFYYNINSLNTDNGINVDKAYFILYNDTKLYKGTVLCNKAKIESNDSISYNFNVKLQFNEDFKLYETINITTDYTLKIFKYNGGSIFTPNYLYFDKINKKDDATITNNIIFSKTTDTTSSYLLNNKILNKTENTITNTYNHYIKYNSGNTDKYYVSQNNYETYALNPSTNIKITGADAGTDDNVLEIIGDNFKNLAATTYIYFNKDIYHSITSSGTKVWTQIIKKEKLYKINTSDANGKITLNGVSFVNNSSAKISIINSGNGVTELLSTAIANIYNNNYINLVNNTSFKYFSSTGVDEKCKLSTETIAGKTSITTRQNNTTNYININNSNLSQKNTYNEFNILVKLYKTILVSSVQYYSLKLNVNAFDNTVLLLKPYHFYTFRINKDLLLKGFNNIYYKISSQKLSITNITGTKTLENTYLSTSSDELNVHIPYESTIYDSNNKLYLKFECEIVKDDDEDTKLKQGYYKRNSTTAYISTTNKFVHYIPILVDKKSVINHTVKYANASYYINNYINKIEFYNYFTHLFDISNENTFDIIVKDSSNPVSSIYKTTSTNKLLIYLDKKSDTYSIEINKSNIQLNRFLITELTNTTPNNDSQYIIYLHNKYDGNDSSNDYVDNVQQKYSVKYSGEPGYNGIFIFNLNKILDFNVNTIDITQGTLFINNDTYFNLNYDLYNFNIKYINNLPLNLVEPIKLKLEYQNVNTLEYIDLVNYTYSTNYFPGKSGSKLTIQIPQDIDNDNIFNENIRLKCVGLYSNIVLSNITNLDLTSDIFTLPQQNSTIFLNINTNTLIRLPIPNYSLEYKFIIISSSINPTTNKSYLLTFTTNNNIYGYIDETLNKNIEIKYDKELQFSNISKGNSFIITSNKDNYYLENISIQRTNNNVSTVNFNKKIIYIPNKVDNEIDINVEENKYILQSTNNDNTNIDSINNVINTFYKDKLYKFNTENLSTNYFNMVDLDPLNPTLINITNSILLNTYNNLYYTLQLNTIDKSSEALFTTYVNNKHIIKYNIIYNSTTNTILFNNSTTTPTIYSNYIYRFIQPVGFYILNNHDYTSIQSPLSTNINETDDLTIITDTTDITLRVNNIIKHSIPTTSIKFTPAAAGTDDNVLEFISPTINAIANKDFTNLSEKNTIYFDKDIYYSSDASTPKTWTKIVSKNVLYTPLVTNTGNSKIILSNVYFTNNTNGKINLSNTSSENGATELSTVKAYVYNNSVNYNTHKIMYVYYIPIKIDSLNNTLTIEETVSGVPTIKNIVLDVNKYKTYTYSVVGNNVACDLLNILNIEVNKEDYVLSIEKDRYKLVHMTNSFKIIETNLSKLLGFNAETSINKTIYGIIPNKQDIFTEDNYYHYYGKSVALDYYTLQSNDSNSSISINLDTDKHIKLPIINEGFTYTFIINNAIINKKLYIHSESNIYYIDNSVTKNGNILIVKPNATNKNLNIGTSITISCNNDKYFIDAKGYEYTLAFYKTRLYNSNNNFSNLYYTETGIANIDKYISIFGIHIIGLYDETNKLENEKKFLHVAKTLARVLDYNQTKTLYDNNIVNSLLKQNSYILLYNKSIPTDYFVNNKHHDCVHIKYSDINISYDYTKNISTTNVLDNTLEKVLEFLVNSYIYTYPHVFNLLPVAGTTSNLSVYKYIDNSRIKFSIILNQTSNQVYLDDRRIIKESREFQDIYYNSNNIKNINYSVGSDLSCRINLCNIDYDNNVFKNLNGSIDIINIGKGYKNNDIIRITLATDLYLVLTIKTLNISDTTKLYNIYNAYNQVKDSILYTERFNENINNTEDDINTTQNGVITNNIDNTLRNYSIELYDKLYDKKMETKAHLNKYVVDLLLGLLGYYKNRNRVYEFRTKIDFNLITPSLIKQYNNIFIGVYFSTSLHKINNITNITSYTLSNINYIKSNNSDLSNLELQINDTTNQIVNYNPIVSTYNNDGTFITFDNSLKFILTPYNQYGTFTTTASSTKNSVVSTLPVVNSTTSKPIIDISNVTANQYYDTTVAVNIKHTSESGKDSNYIVNLKRNAPPNKTNINIIEKIIILSDNVEVNKNENIGYNVNNIVYFKQNVENVIQIVLKNIYSKITSFKIDNAAINNSNTEHKYSYNYNITPLYYKENATIAITTENGTVANVYDIILMKQQNSIATLDNVIISNVENINMFNKNVYNYNGLLNQTVFNTLVKNGLANTDDITNISLSIKKTDIYSTVNTTMEYLDSTNKYILFKQTTNEFIDNIFTFPKINGTTYKDVLFIKSDSNLYKSITGNNLTSVLNIYDAGNSINILTVRIKIKVLSEDKKEEKIYTYIIQLR